MGVLNRLNLWTMRWPLLASGLSLGMRYAVGDCIGQFVEHKTSGKERFELQVKRTFAFASFGAFYGALPGYAVYNLIYPAIFGFSRPVFNAVFDVVVQCPMVYFPLFYAAKEAIFSDAKELTQRPLQVVRSGLKKWKDNFVEDFKMCTAVWLPLNTIMFRYVPLHLRMPFLSGAGLVWVMILSLSRGAAPSPEQIMEEIALPQIVPVSVEVPVLAKRT